MTSIFNRVVSTLRLDLRRVPCVYGLMRRAYHWQPPVEPEYIERRFGVERVAYWESGGQWAAVLARP